MEKKLSINPSTAVPTTPTVVPVPTSTEVAALTSRVASVETSVGSIAIPANLVVKSDLTDYVHLNTSKLIDRAYLSPIDSAEQVVFNTYVQSFMQSDIGKAVTASIVAAITNIVRTNTSGVIDPGLMPALPDAQKPAFYALVATYLQTTEGIALIKAGVASNGTGTGTGTGGDTTPAPTTGISTNKISFTSADGGVIENGNTFYFTDSNNNTVGGAASDYAIAPGVNGSFQIPATERTGAIKINTDKALVLGTNGANAISLWLTTTFKFVSRAVSTSLGSEYVASETVTPGTSLFGQLRLDANNIYGEYSKDGGSTWTVVNKAPRVAGATYWISVVTDFGSGIRTTVTHFNAAVPSTGSATPTQAVINFSVASAKTMGDAPFSLTATSNNTTAPITYVSSNPSVISVSNSSGSWKATVVSTGSANITASQAASTGFLAAVDVARTITVGTTAPPVPSTGISTNPITFSAADGGVIENGNTAHFTNANGNGVGAFSSDYGIAAGTNGAFQMPIIDNMTGCLSLRASKGMFSGTGGTNAMSVWYNPNAQNRLIARSDSTTLVDAYKATGSILPSVNFWAQIRLDTTYVYTEYTTDNGATWTVLQQMPRVANTTYWVNVVSDFGTDIRTTVTQINATII
jgi:hypothetical protein